MCWRFRPGCASLLAGQCGVSVSLTLLDRGEVLLKAGQVAILWASDRALLRRLDRGEVLLKAKPIEKIIFGHKIALKDLDADEKIIKYGQVIGVASRKIKVGEWVHTHNVNSARMNTEGEEMRGVT